VALLVLSVMGQTLGVDKLFFPPIGIDVEVWVLYHYQLDVRLVSHDSHVKQRLSPALLLGLGDELYMKSTVLSFNWKCQTDFWIVDW
jgi:hypothetical protein